MPQASNIPIKASLLALLLTTAGAPGPQAAQQQGTDVEAGLPFWAWQDATTEIRLVQRLPDQTRAFFIGRGFTAEMADRIAGGCVFQTIVRNRGPQVTDPVLGIDLGAWRLDAGSGPKALPSKADWDRAFAEAGESEAARIAFRWSLFPSAQAFRGGDYNWGMISMGVPPGTQFVLDLAWTLTKDGLAQPQNAKLRGLICAPEDAAQETANPSTPTADTPTP